MESFKVGLGLMTGQSVKGRTDMPEAYGGVVDIGRAAEVAGFDSIWVSEHHATPDGYIGSPLPVLAALGGATARISLGAGLTLPALTHPVRFALDSVTTHLVTNQRLILGIGLGYRAEEDALFGVDPKGRIGRLTHAVDVTRRLMRGEEVSAQGDGTEQVGVRLPLEHAGISMPIWFGGFAPPAIQRAARLGDGYLIGSGDYARICSLLDVLDSTPPVSETFEVAVQQYVIPSDSGIDPAIILRGLEYQQAVYGTWSGPSSPAVVSGTTDEIVDSLMPLLERLNRYARVHYVFRSLVPGLTSAESCELALWLGTEVVPRLKAASGVAP